MRAIKGCTLDTKGQHLHSETEILPFQTHLKLYSSQLIQKALNLTYQFTTISLTTKKAHPRYKKQSTFNDNKYVIIMPTNNNTTHTKMKKKIKTIYTKLVHDCFSTTHNKILNSHPYMTHKSP